MLPAVNLSHVQELKLARLVHGGGWQELGSFLDFDRDDGRHHPTGQYLIGPRKPLHGFSIGRGQS